MSTPRPMSQSEAEAPARSAAAGLDARQAEAVATEHLPFCVLAGAGSGKTRVLTKRVARRIADGSASAEHTLVLTFTRKAAEELRERLGRNEAARQVTAGTFHSIAYAQLRNRFLDAGRVPPAILGSPGRVVQAALENIRLDRSVDARHLVTEIGWAKGNRLDAENYERMVTRTNRRTPLPPRQFVKILTAYEAEKKKRHVVDYDDLLLMVTDAIESDKAFAQAQRWLFRHFYVDEFQDLNRAQFDLLRAWLGDRNDLFVVGDPNQAIYEWNGADAGFLTEIRHHFPVVQTINLDTNYRSTSQVLAAAAAVLPSAPTDRPDHDADGVLTAVDGPRPTVTAYVDERGEAVGIARKVRKVHGSGRRWSDIAVLVRTNVQRKSIETALSQAQIPFSSGTGTSWVHSAVLKPAMQLMDDKGGQPLDRVAADITEMVHEAGEDDRPLLLKLEAMVRQSLDRDPNTGTSDFVSWLEISSRNDGPDGGTGVVVTTFHRAKGLEWPAVFLAGLDAALVPFGGLKTQRVDEERRLFYVAITRAREELHLSWSHERPTGGGVVECKRSPWLDSIVELFGQDEAKPDVNVPALLTAGREALDETADEGRPCAALQRWRERRAKLTGVRPSLILADAVLDAIVDLRPQTVAELAEVEGFGPVRAANDGDEVLAALRD